ncbi:type I methionyl aminopeptidase [Buchnera aphidicola]|uniref:type I methionyl aminopeptidase n=1 Tax=Buchnera aphidicola TaxID=9 RepID=UPI00254336B8|nr:type I methionyl aminopeptidase [Buchnera aphidicola]WII23831.1 type I methionyl aminopeptidase [Buchnera aphidicola (Sipha maydis)]
MIIIKNNYDIKKMQIVCKLTAQVLDFIKKYISAGISTEKINKICHNYIIDQTHSIPACLGYQGYPKSVCISLNNVVCHGIPNKKTILKNGDILNIDIALVKENYFGDASKMYTVGKCSKIAKKLCKTTLKCLYSSIKIIKPGINLNEIGKTIEKIAKKNNFSIVKEYCGHGIGKNFHEEPYVLHYYEKNQNIKLQEGMIFTIEPMLNVGKRHIFREKDNWTVKTRDKSLSAQYEHTILVTKTGYKVLTLGKNEKI